MMAFSLFVKVQKFTFLRHIWIFAGLLRLIGLMPDIAVVLGSVFPVKLSSGRREELTGVFPSETRQLAKRRFSE